MDTNTGLLLLACLIGISVLIWTRYKTNQSWKARENNTEEEREIFRKMYWNQRLTTFNHYESFIFPISEDSESLYEAQKFIDLSSMAGFGVVSTIPGKNHVVICLQSQ